MGQRAAARVSCRSRSFPAAIALRSSRRRTRRAKPAACGRLRCPAERLSSRRSTRSPANRFCSIALPCAAGSIPNASASISIRATSAARASALPFPAISITPAPSRVWRLGFAAQQMSVAAFKQIWPIMLSTRVRAWVLEHLDNGAIDRVDIAINAPLSTLQTGGPPVPDDGISIEVVTTGATIRPVDGLPPITDADLVTRINGRVATIALGRGTVDLGTGRKLTVTNGLFEVPDTQVDKPPARGALRIDGPVPAAAELLASDRLTEFSGAPIDPATSRGTVTAQVGVALALDPDAPPGIDDLHDHDRRDEFRDRSSLSCRKRSKRRRCASRRTIRAIRSRATFASPVRPRRSNIARCATRPTRNSGCRQRSTMRRARGLAPISAARSPGRSPCGSPARLRSIPIRTAGFLSMPI